MEKIAIWFWGKVTEFCSWVIAHAESLINSLMGFARGSIENPRQFAVSAVALGIACDLVHAGEHKIVSFILEKSVSFPKEILAALKITDGLYALGAIVIITFLLVYKKHLK